MAQLIKNASILLHFHAARNSRGLSFRGIKLFGSRNNLVVAIKLQRGKLADQTFATTTSNILLESFLLIAYVHNLRK